MIDSFQGSFRFLSNFWPASVMLEGRHYKSVEHAYQAAKTLDPEMRRVIAHLQTPGQAKRQGQKFSLRNDWEDVKLEVMEKLVREKFSNKFMAAKLLATGEEELVEGNTWGDTFWGVCNGRGHNHLGKILMRIRAELRSQ